MEPEARPASAEPAPQLELELAPPPASAADAAMRAYVCYLAGWFELGRLAAGRRLERSGVDAPLLTDL